MIKRVPKEKVEAFNAVVSDLKDQVDAILKKAKKFESEGTRNNTTEGYYKRIIAANLYLDSVNLYCKMNDYSVQIKEVKSDLYLTNARKNVYQAIKLLETIVSGHIDLGLTENAEKLSQLSEMAPPRLLHLFKKIEFSIALVEREEGENSKVKWNFVEMYGNLAAVMKNFINFKVYTVAMNDPRVPYYAEIRDLIQYCKEMLDKAAQKYRTKYELSTPQDSIDMNKAINLMEALMKVHNILGENDQMIEVKKTVEKWREKLEADLKRREEEAKKKQKEKGR
ncbi:hypothetical protein [Thermospira aquatica]|uniref:Uncharacterized protein n=1 Tax=Thermospira aquatica TaxID=2828656 RepID=A0AAX3BCE5_9SPIR|nr:hypothetical protein [Thermospira aquatica]URA09959.1 hypothetical protein KDW03_10835 [Thermospira aquatica]